MACAGGAMDWTVWTTDILDGDNTGVFAQRFDGFLAYEERPLGDGLVYA